MKHIDVTSQVTRHQMLMDLAKKVQDHVDQNPSDDEPAHETEHPYVPGHLYHSPK